MSFNRLHTIDLINAFCTAQSISDGNFIACTLKVPLTSSFDEQHKELTKQLEQLNVHLSGCFEWIDKRADGWHFHFIANVDQLQHLINKGVHIIRGYNLEGWINYLTKADPAKKYKEINTRKESVVPDQPSNEEITKEITKGINTRKESVVPDCIYILRFGFLSLFIYKEIIRMIIPRIRPAP